MPDVSGRPDAIAQKVYDALDNPQFFGLAFKTWLVSFLSSSDLTIPAGNVSGSVAGSTIYDTAPPGSPTDGTEWVFVDDKTNPTYQWRFRYNAGSAHTDKWEFVGGVPLVRRTITSEDTASGTYVTLPSGPTITVPRSGVYLIGGLGARVDTTVATPLETRMTYKVGAGGTPDDNYSIPIPVSTNWHGAGAQGPMGLAGALTLTAGTVIYAVYHTDGVTDVLFSARWMSLIPIRVS